ncbi:MAG: FAA hydrolase family protein, partial [Pseudolabrys sp.]
MRIVGFESNNSARLGIVDGDNVIDLQIADANLSGDLGEVLRRINGDLKPLAALAKNAPSSARRSLAGLKFALPVARPGKIICLGLNYLDHVKEGPQ